MRTSDSANKSYLSEFKSKAQLFVISISIFLLDSADDADDYNVGVILEYLAADWPIVFSADFKTFFILDV